MRTIKVFYKFITNDGQCVTGGVYTVSTGYKTEKAIIAIKNTICRYLNLAGLKVDVNNIEVIDTEEPMDNENFDNNDISTYIFANFKSGKGAGPWHMFAGSTESGGLACGSNRRMSTIVKKVERSSFPDGKICYKCKKLWKGKQHGKEK